MAGFIFMPFRVESYLQQKCAKLAEIAIKLIGTFEYESNQDNNLRFMYRLGRFILPHADTFC